MQFDYRYWEPNIYHSHRPLQSYGISPTITVAGNSHGVFGGDLAILVDSVANVGGTGIPADVTPTGWISIHKEDGSGTIARCNLSYKVLTNADLGNVITGMNGTVFAHKHICYFHVNGLIREVIIGGATGNLEDAGAAPAHVNAAPTAANGFGVLVFGAGNSGSNIDDGPGSFAPDPGWNGSNFYGFVTPPAGVTQLENARDVPRPIRTCWSFYDRRDVPVAQSWGIFNGED